MRIYIDQQMVKRNKRIGKILRWVSIVFLGVALFAVFSPNIINNPTMVNIYFAVMIVGVAISSIGNHMTTRYGRSPRPDEMLDRAFKGLDDRYSILHYQTEIPHLLIGQSGIWSLIPTYVDGTITFDEKKQVWVRKGGSFVNRILSREAFGRPDKELAQNQKDLNKLLKSKGLDETIELHGAVILLNKNADFSGKDQANRLLVLPYEKAKEKIRKLSKTQPEIPAEIVSLLTGC